MKFAALTSGGKDSILAVCKALDAGKSVSSMVSVVPENRESYMFHSVNLNAVPVMAQRANMVYIAVKSAGEKEAEVADLEAGLAKLDIDGVTVGAIESEYQCSRVAKICDSLGITMFAPLWGADPHTVLEDTARLLDARIVVTAADGLGANVLGKRIDAELIQILDDVARRRRIHIAGEGGEYESLVLNAPFFSAPLNHSEMKITCGAMSGKAEIERFW
ncbi:MAG TPA: diphthine--ammonia ligase [Methanocorpusculum sp.]|nr:diphthine--ammonia ligase [Methanocorpusculum sp.]